MTYHNPKSKPANDDDLIGEVDIDRDMLEWLYGFDEDEDIYDDLSESGAEL